MIQILTVHLLSSYWLANFRGYGPLTLGASALGTALEGFLCGILAFLYPSTLNTKSNLENQLKEGSGKAPFAGFKRTLWFSAVWLFFEWNKSNGFLGYPWGTLFSAAYRWRIIAQLASVTGVWGITFIFALFSSLVGEGFLLIHKNIHFQNAKALISNYRQLAYFTFTIFALVFVYGILAYIMPQQETKSIKAIMVQQNIDPWEAEESEAIKKSMDLTRAELDKLDEDENVDLIIWSEGVLGRSFPNSASYYSTHPEEESLSDFIASTNTPFIIGGRTSVNNLKRHYTNTALLFDSSGKFSAFYSKIHLVPFAEGLPYQNNPTISALLKKLIPFSFYRSGNQFVLYQIPIKKMQDFSTPLEYRNDLYKTITLSKNGRASSDDIRYFSENKAVNPDSYLSFTTPICFEDSFNDVCRPLWKMGSEVFINITNDSWSKTDVAEYQHFIIASYRAIEYRTTLVRTCNSGYSVVVDPKGRIVKDMKVFEDAAMCTDIPIYERKNTIFSKCGDWFAYLIFICMAIYALYFFIKNFPWPEKRIYRFITIDFHVHKIFMEEHEKLKEENLLENDKTELDEENLLKAEKQPVKEKGLSKKKTSSVKKDALSKAGASSTKKAPAKKTATSTKKADSVKEKTTSTKKTPSPKEKATSTKKATSPKEKAASTKKATPPKEKATSTKKATSPKEKAASTKKATSVKEKAASTKKAPPPKGKAASTKAKK